jgi:hypothetical protein
MLAHRGLYQTRVEHVRCSATSPSSPFTSVCAADPTAITRAGALASMPPLEAESAVGRCEQEEAGWRRVSCE